MFIAPSIRRLLSLWLTVLGIICVREALAQAPAPQRKLAIVASIAGTIDLGLGPFVARVLERAREERADVVVLNIDTFGGRVDAAVAIRDSLLKSPVKTVAFVNKRAISAGALIALSAEKIVIARGGTIGAATPVQMGQPGEGAAAVGEKTVSYVRKEFRATADARKRPGLLAEAMVDADVEIEGVISKGKLLTLTTEDALKYGVADFEADDLPRLLEGLGLAGAEVRHDAENWAERLVRFLTHPVVSSLLMTLGMLGLVVELRTPGFGVPGIVGFLCLASFFWGHWLVALVGWEQLLLLLAGLVLIAIELLVLPGFGVAGIAGGLAVLAALSTSLFGAGASGKIIALSLSRVVISAALASVAFLVLLRFLPTLPGSRKLVLASGFGGDGRPEGEGMPPGVTGSTLTALRPAGIALLAGRRLDVVSDGEFIDPGQDIEIVRDEGHRIVVRRKASNAGGVAE
jgi:membrane-bound serine protease (ClpP class)